MDITEAGILKARDFSEVAIAESLVGWWPLNGDTKDLTEYMNDGTNNGATLVSGHDGKMAYEFTTSSRISVDTLTLTGDLTITYWINPGRESNYRVLNAANFAHCVWHPTSTQIGLDDRNQSGSMRYINFSQASILANSWSHIAVTRKDNTTIAYINGVNEGSVTNWSERIELSRIGYKTDNTGWSAYTGKIQDVRIYNRTLSPEEIAILYEMTGGSNSKMKMSEDGILYIKGEFNEV